MLTLKQARRMVAKSRRRVWRWVRRFGFGDYSAAWPHDNSTTAYVVEVVLPEVVTGYLNRIQVESLEAEFSSRRGLLRRLEAAADERAWVRYRQRQARAIELPALDHGQDGDELLQDIADYYADPDAQAGLDDDLYSEPCPVCGDSMDWEDCPHCVDGYNGHDCGEDVCCCLYPEDNEVCDVCDGRGGWYVCWRKHKEA